jgi:hypothetical protein
VRTALANSLSQISIEPALAYRNAALAVGTLSGVFASGVALLAVIVGGVRRGGLGRWTPVTLDGARLSPGAVAGAAVRHAAREVVVSLIGVLIVIAAVLTALSDRDLYRLGFVRPDAGPEVLAEWLTQPAAVLIVGMWAAAAVDHIWRRRIFFSEQEDNDSPSSAEEQTADPSVRAATRRGIGSND